MMRVVPLLCFFLAAAGPAVVQAATCVDPDGNEVDFWYSFMFPGSWEYAYMADGVKLAKGDGTLDDETSALARTLAQVYGETHRKELSYAMWNDEHSDGKKIAGPRAHSKGVLAFDGKSGFWLTHSLPSFPDASGSKPFATGAQVYGQSYLCITIDSDGLDVISDVFASNYPSVYLSEDNANAGDGFTAWAITQKHDKSASNTAASKITSKGGKDFMLFGKSAAWADDLYDSLVVPHYKKDFEVETWQNGVGKMASNCDAGGHTVENVKSVKFPGSDGWTETKDHSKWAVSKDGKIFCVGDINRQTGQRKRGGGTVCVEDATFAKQMLSVIDTVEECSNTVVV